MAGLPCAIKAAERKKSVLLVNKNKEIGGKLFQSTGQIAAAGSPQEIGEIKGVTSISCPGEVVMPGLVNAHAHLDLTSIGPVGADEGFSKWLDHIRIARPKDNSSIAEAVHAAQVMPCRPMPSARSSRAIAAVWPLAISSRQRQRGRTLSSPRFSPI